MAMAMAMAMAIACGVPRCCLLRPAAPSCACGCRWPRPASPVVRLAAVARPLLAPFRRPRACTPCPPRLRAARAHAVAGGGNSQHQDLPFDITRLEHYTQTVTNEVLRVHAVVDGEEDQVLIFKGFSSSLMRSTAYDPAEPVLPPSATIRAIDRIRGPFNPAKVLLIKGGRGLSWQQFQTLLEEKGL